MLKFFTQGIVFILLGAQAFAQASSDDLNLAVKIYNRINSVKVGIDSPIIISMAEQVANKNLLRAAQLATSEDSFINITVRDFAVQMSTREEALSIPLNDFTATVMGIVRDDIDAREMLTADYFYKADPAKMMESQDMIADLLRSNRHYEKIEALRLNAKNILVQEPQKMLRNERDIFDHPDTAGVLTTRAFLGAHHVAGTGRRPVEFTFREFLCLGIDEVADNSGPDDRIGRDIPRFPGGDHNEFKTSCKSCHVPMDGFRGAFAFFTFARDSVQYGNIENAGRSAGVDGFDRMPASDGNENYVSRKFNWNTDQYPQGFVTTDDSWVNYANLGKNKTVISWPEKTSGKGVGSFGEIVSKTKAFPRCMAKRVYKSLCKRAPSSLESSFIESVAVEFENNNYNIRNLFEKIAISKECVGE